MNLKVGQQVLVPGGTGQVLYFGIGTDTIFILQGKRAREFKRSELEAANSDNGAGGDFTQPPEQPGNTTIGLTPV